MRYLHTMVRVSDLEKGLSFWRDHLGLVEIRRKENREARYTLVFLAASEDVENARTKDGPLIELTWNWDPETYSGGRNFGHVAYGVADIYATCQKIMDAGIVLNRPPRDGRMAFIRSPEGISIELLQLGKPLPVQEPWCSLPNQGSW